MFGLQKSLSFISASELGLQEVKILSKILKNWLLALESQSYEKKSFVTCFGLVGDIFVFFHHF
jgi:hypothetical protein